MNVCETVNQISEVVHGEEREIYEPGRRGHKEEGVMGEGAKFLSAYIP